MFTSIIEIIVSSLVFLMLELEIYKKKKKENLLFVKVFSNYTLVFSCRLYQKDSIFNSEDLHIQSAPRKKKINFFVVVVTKILFKP